LETFILAVQPFQLVSEGYAVNQDFETAPV